jgi:signal transduction histidine kinase/CheY-like chemotaxis protein
MSATGALLGDDEALSPAGRAMLMRLNFSRVPMSVFVVPVIALSLTLFYARTNDAAGMALWTVFHIVFSIFLRIRYRDFSRDITQLSDTDVLNKWMPFAEKITTLYGLSISAPALITLGKAPFDFQILLLLVIAAITISNATYQTPRFDIFGRFFVTGWCVTVLTIYWNFPNQWMYVLPISLAFTAGAFRQARVAYRFYTKQIVLEERSIQLTAQYKAAKEQAEEALGAKNLFLTTASHDLRQPVHAMGMLIEAIVQRNEQQNLAPLLGDLKSSVQSVNLMFNSLLDLSKIESGHLDNQASEVALQPLLQGVCIMFREEASRRGLQLRMRVSSAHACVHTDASLLRQAVQNLVQNALRYTQTGGVLVAIRRRGVNWHIEVWDTGMGVSDEERDQIYTPFYRNENAWRIDSAGHGLGLAVVARCAKLMGANYGLKSRLGRGSRFWLQLPAMQQTSASAVLANTAPQLNSTAALRPLHGSCLVVEDDPQVTSAWQALFQAWQVDARFVTTASDAFKALDTGFAPRAILCDHRLRSGESGFDILRALLGRCPDASGAMVSGEYNSPELVAAQNDGYLVMHKPLDITSLHEVLVRWFDT